MKKLLEKLYVTNTLAKDEIMYILSNINDSLENDLFRLANLTKKNHYGNKVYIRGLIEFSNFCKNTCKYCGLRCQNKNINRYRLMKNEILECCHRGYKLGIRTFVLQSGEDSYFHDELLVELTKEIKYLFNNTAVTFSIGEKSRTCYKKLYKAGADRYLLRQETVNKNLYQNMHPRMSLENRLRCLTNLLDIGYQTGSGFIVGLPGQTDEILAEDILFLKNNNFQMVGLGAFIPHPDTPLSSYNQGSLRKTLICVALVRLLLPKTLLPATTALAVISPDGWNKGIIAGANVIMLNLSPSSARENYEIYQGKNDVSDEAEISLQKVKNDLKNSGSQVDMGRGDYIGWNY